MNLHETREENRENKSITLKKKVLRFFDFQQNLQGLPREAFVIHKSLKFIPAVKKEFQTQECHET